MDLQRCSNVHDWIVLKCETSHQAVLSPAALLLKPAMAELAMLQGRFQSCERIFSHHWCYDISIACVTLMLFCPCRAQCSGTGCAVLSKHVMPYEINSICNVHKNDRTGASERWIQNRFPGSFWWDGEFRPFRRRVVSCVGGPLGPAIIANTAFVHIHASKQSKLHTYHEVIAIRFRGCTLSAEPDRWGRCGNPCRGSHRWVQRGETQRWQEKRCRFLNLRCLGYDHKLTSPQRNRASIRTSMLA